MTDAPIIPTPPSVGLRTPFHPAQIGKLPRVTRKDGDKTRCAECGGWLPPHIHLDYVGHAVVTDRLLDVDPGWNWEPVAWDTDGTPLVRIGGRQARLWIRLTVAGVTRLGVGIVESEKPELEKELISDAIRNAAMRFGVALDLWAKEELHAPDTGEVRTEAAVGTARPAPTIAPVPAGGDPTPSTSGPRLASKRQRAFLESLIEKHTVPPGCAWPLDDDLTAQDASQYIDVLNALPDPPVTRAGPKKGETLKDAAERLRTEFNAEMADGSEPF